MTACTCDEMADGNTCPACALGVVDDETDAEPLVWRKNDKTRREPATTQDDEDDETFVYLGAPEIDGDDLEDAVRYSIETVSDRVADSVKSHTPATTDAEPLMMEHSRDPESATFVETDELPYSWTTWIGHPTALCEYGFNRVNGWFTDPSYGDSPRLYIPDDFPAEWIVEAIELAGYDIKRFETVPNDDWPPFRIRHADPDADRRPVAGVYR